MSKKIRLKMKRRAKRKVASVDWSVLHAGLRIAVLVNGLDEASRRVALDSARTSQRRAFRCYSAILNSYREVRE